MLLYTEEASETLQEVLNLRREKEELAAKLKGIQAKLDAAERSTLDLLAEAGGKIEFGGATLYSSRRVWATIRPERKAELLEKLREVAPHLVTTNAQSLSSWVKEHLDGDELDPSGLPGGVGECVEVKEQITLCVRGG